MRGMRFHRESREDEYDGPSGGGPHGGGGDAPAPTSELSGSDEGSED